MAGLDRLISAYNTSRHPVCLDEYAEGTDQDSSNIHGDEPKRYLFIHVLYDDSCAVVTHSVFPVHTAMESDRIDTSSDLCTTFAVATSQRKNFRERGHPVTPAFGCARRTRSNTFTGHT
jgi:hypothetical protein